MTEIQELNLRRIAHIVSPFSSAAAALADAEKKRAEGQEVRFFLSEDAIIVQAKEKG